MPARPDVRFGVLETHGYPSSRSGGNSPPGVSAHVYDWDADRVRWVYRSEERWGPGGGYRGRSIGVEEAVRRAQLHCDVLNQLDAELALARAGL